MTQTEIGRLRSELLKAAAALETFEEFRSPVNQAVVVAVWAAKRDDEIVQVAVRESRTGIFYRSQIIDPSARSDGWVVLADDREVVPGVSADMFAAIKVVPKP